MANPIDEYTMQISGQKELMQQQGEESMKPYLPQLHQQVQEAQAVVLQQINPHKVVDNVLLELQGKERNDDGQLVQLYKPYVNDEGLKNIKIRMKSVVNQNTVMSNLEEREIRGLMLSLANDLAFDLALNWREYGIKNRTTCDIVMNIVLINSYTALKRSQDKNEKQFLKGIAFESIGGAASQSGKRKKEGGWESLASKIRL